MQITSQIERSLSSMRGIDFAAASPFDAASGSATRFTSVPPCGATRAYLGSGTRSSKTRGTASTFKNDTGSSHFNPPCDPSLRSERSHDSKMDMLVHHLGEAALCAEGACGMSSTLRTIAAGLDHAFRRVHFDLDPSIGATTFVAGTGRSGTAWAANIVNYDHRARYIFEPFNPFKVSECAGFRYRQYLRPTESAEKYVGPARIILSGRITNDWIDQFNRAFVSRRRVVKEIRANLMLKWLKERFPGIRLIMMFRHPCADANSRLRLGWQSHLDELLAQDDLVADHLAPFVADMRSAATQFERHV